MAEDQSQLDEALDKVLHTAKEISEQQSQLFGRALDVQSSLAGTVITGVNDVMKKLAQSASEALNTVSETVKKENQ
jgi:ABC-type transporter Mla subunit MlaD